MNPNMIVALALAGIALTLMGLERIRFNLEDRADVRDQELREAHDQAIALTRERAL